MAYTKPVVKLSIKNIKIHLCSILFMLISFLHAENLRVTQDANIREKPTTNSQIIEVAKKGTILNGKFLENSDWCEIDFKGETRYISKSVVEIKKESQTTKSDFQRHPILFSLMIIAIIVLFVIRKKRFSVKKICAIICCIIILIISFFVFIESIIALLEAWLIFGLVLFAYFHGSIGTHKWQCKNCGYRPTSISKGVPSRGNKCPANRQKHIWEKIPKGPSNANAWRCKYCGAKPKSWYFSRPVSGDCPATGFRHVWKLL